MNFAVIVLMGVFSYALFKLSEKNLDFFEKLCRNRRFGVIIGFPLLCWCVPHTRAIIFNWAAPYLWYMVIVLTILSYFYLDYLLARSIGGAFIIGAYYFVHAGYEFHAAGAAIMTIIAWIWGIAGIFISGKPSFLRDYFRKCTVSTWMKMVSFIFFAATAVIFAVSGIGELLK